MLVISGKGMPYAWRVQVTGTCWVRRALEEGLGFQGLGIRV